MPPRDPAGVTGGRILVVDDEPYITDVVTATLRFEGFSSDEAVTGLEALEKARKDEYDLIVLDVMLPDVEGFEVCRRMREENIRTPVLFLTARDATVDKLAACDKMPAASRSTAACRRRSPTPPGTRRVAR